MRIHFYKYQATGNDFVLLDNRKPKNVFSEDQIKRICDRRFGIGSDGLILIEEDSTSDFKMLYYNSDGTQSLCGNGCRAAVDFASRLSLIGNFTVFSAFDGNHEASILKNKYIRLRMNDVTEVVNHGGDYFLDTGSPHYIKFVPATDEINVVKEGKRIRMSDSFKPNGTNVNFVTLLEENKIAVRTYERGVENETLSCGTGVTAAALAASYHGYLSPVSIQVQGGALSVEFKSEPACRFSDVFLTGPAKIVFQGQWEL